MSFKTFYQNNKIVLLLIAFILALSIFTAYEIKRASNLKVKLATTSQNLAASQDTLRITKDKLGKSEYDKLIYVAKTNDLQKLNADLAAEVKATKGTVATIGKAEVIIKHDTLPLIVHTNPTVAENGDTAITSHFNQDTTYSPGNYSKVNGTITYDPKTKQSTGDVSTQVGFDLITGIKNIHTKPEIFVRSNHPGFNVTSLTGAVLDPSLFVKPKEKRVSFGIQIGYSPLSYNLSTKTFSGVSQITLGAGINYRIF